MDSEGFKLNLQSIANSKSKPNQSDDWQKDLTTGIKQFNDLYHKQKETLLTKLEEVETYEERKPILDDFFSSIETKSKEVKDSEGYKNFKQL